MSAIPGHVTRKDGRIVELPETVNKFLKWLTGVCLVMPVILLLTGLFSPRSVLPVWAGILLGILPFGIVITALVAALRAGKAGTAAYSSVLVLMNYFAMTLEPHTSSVAESLLLRTVPIICMLATIWFLKQDLHYNLRPMWYSLQAMRDLQQQMANMKAAKDAKKRGEVFDPSKVIDAEAMVREVSAKTGRDIPAHMAGGFNMKPGFRQQSKDGSKRDGGDGRQRKRK